MYTMIREAQKIKIESAGLSDPGKSRKLNQDTIFHQIGQINGGKPAGLFIVCDGIGGQRGGEIASRIAVDTITAELPHFFAEAPTSSKNGDTHPSFFTLNQKMRAAIEEANAQICQYADDHPDETPYLGTTVTAVLIYGNLVHIINAGDGRVYICRQGQLTQVTQDHSLAAKLAQKGFIDETEIATHPQNHIILRALGVKEHIELDAFDRELEPGDKILICSDGLWKAFPDSSELGQLLQINTTAAALCHQLVSEAKRRDGSDNISAIVVTVSEVGEY
ncbi:MAG: serine/threonine-protein phosphatase [Chloroflexi bacterium]|nr:serine/threonine-protein phosphatase [Chloroflexota bacterium]